MPNLRAAKVCGAFGQLRLLILILLFTVSIFYVKTSASKRVVLKTAAFSAKKASHVGRSLLSTADDGGCDPFGRLVEHDVPVQPVPGTSSDPRFPNATDNNGRAVYISVLTADHTDQLIVNWARSAELWFSQHDTHFMLVMRPDDARVSLPKITKQLGWTKLLNFTKAQKQFACEGAVDMPTPEEDGGWSGWYSSPLRVTVLIYVRHFRLPSYFANATDSDLRRPCGFNQCCTRDQSGNIVNGRDIPSNTLQMDVLYNLITIAHWHHVIVDMDILDLYDYVFKYDADNEIITSPGASPQKWMKKHGCVLFNIGVKETGHHQHCHNHLASEMAVWGARNNLTVQSAQSGWCAQQNEHFMGLLLGVWRPFIRSKANRQLSRYLYDHDTKFFRLHDQGAIMAYLCAWYNVRYLNSRPLICDYRDWRNFHITHPGRP